MINGPGKYSVKIAAPGVTIVARMVRRLVRS
jgi:hypothetical protein